MTKLLLQYGTNVIALNIDEHPLLYFALERNDVYMARLFIDAAPDQIPMTGKYDRWLPLHYGLSQLCDICEAASLLWSSS